MKKRCPQCGKKLDLPAPGKYKCPACFARFTLEPEPAGQPTDAQAPPATLPPPRPTANRHAAEPAEDPQFDAAFHAAADLADVAAADPAGEDVEVAGSIAPLLAGMAVLIAAMVGGALWFAGVFSPAPHGDAAAGRKTQTIKTGGKLARTDGGGDSLQAQADELSKLLARQNGKTAAGKTQGRGKNGFSVFGNGPGKTAGKTGKANLAAAASPWAGPQWSILVPAGVTPLLDGLPTRPPAARWPRASWTLVIAPGRHVVHSKASPLATINTTVGFVQFYDRQTAQLKQGGRYEFERLLDTSRASRGVFRDPLLPHHWGNFYWQENEREAAVRLWKAAVNIEPTFAPAHLNLAFAYVQSGNLEPARRELRLAAALNPQDGYGLRAHLRALRAQLPVATAPELTQPAGFDPDDYAETSLPLSADELRVIDALSAIAEYVTQPAERVRAINNVGAFLASRGKPQTALRELRRALAVLVDAGDSGRHEKLLHHLYDHMARVARNAGMPEHRFYDSLRNHP